MRNSRRSSFSQSLLPYSSTAVAPGVSRDSSVSSGTPVRACRRTGRQDQRVAVPEAVAGLSQDAGGACLAYRRYQIRHQNPRDPGGNCPRSLPPPGGSRQQPRQPRGNRPRRPSGSLSIKDAVATAAPEAGTSAEPGISLSDVPLFSDAPQQHDRGIHAQGARIAGAYQRSRQCARSARAPRSRARPQCREAASIRR